MVLRLLSCLRSNCPIAPREVVRSNRDVERNHERWNKSRAGRRHRSEQPYGTTGHCLWNGLTGKCHDEGYHDGRSVALSRPGGNQQPERRRDAAQGRGHREQEDSG